MSYDLTKITYFQFDNLVQNRISFLLVHDGLDFARLYPMSTERSHLERWSFDLDFDQSSMSDVSVRLKERGVPLTIPVVIASKSPRSLSGWAADFEKSGFMNVHTIDQGWDALVREAQEAR